MRGVCGLGGGFVRKGVGSVHKGKRPTQKEKGGMEIRFPEKRIRNLRTGKKVWPKRERMHTATNDPQTRGRNIKRRLGKPAFSQLTWGAGHELRGVGSQLRGALRRRCSETQERWPKEEVGPRFIDHSNEREATILSSGG